MNSSNCNSFLKGYKFLFFVEMFLGEEMWLAFLERMWVTCCSYPIETCSSPKFLEKECFLIIFSPREE